MCLIKSIGPDLSWYLFRTGPCSCVSNLTHSLAGKGKEMLVSGLVVGVRRVCLRLACILTHLPDSISTMRYALPSWLWNQMVLARAFPRECYKELHVTLSSQEILRRLSSLFMRTTGVVSMLGSSHLGLSTWHRWFYSMMSCWMSQLAAQLSVSEWGVRHNHMDQPWEETMWYCVLSV